MCLESIYMSQATAHAKQKDQYMPRQKGLLTAAVCKEADF